MLLDKFTTCINNKDVLGAILSLNSLDINRIYNISINAGTAFIYQQTPLMYAIQEGATEVALVLIEMGADVNIKSWQYEAALHVASEYGDTDVVVALIKSGADLEFDKACSPLHYSATYGFLEISKILINAGVDVNIIDVASGYTPLHYAVYNNHVETVSFLLKQGADPSVRDLRGDAAEDIALQRNYQRILESMQNTHSKV